MSLFVVQSESSFWWMFDLLSMSRIVQSCEFVHRSLAPAVGRCGYANYKGRTTSRVPLNVCQYTLYMRICTFVRAAARPRDLCVCAGVGLGRAPTRRFEAGISVTHVITYGRLVSYRKKSSFSPGWRVRGSYLVETLVRKLSKSYQILRSNWSIWDDLARSL